MGHCSCCAHTHECAPEKHIEKQESIFSEYWKVGLSFILLISGIVMNALDFTFSVKDIFLDMVYCSISPGWLTRNERSMGEYKG